MQQKHRAFNVCHITPAAEGTATRRENQQSFSFCGVCILVGELNRILNHPVLFTMRYLCAHADELSG